MKEYEANSLPIAMGNSRRPLRITVVKLSDIAANYGNAPKGLSKCCEKSCPCFQEGSSYVVTDKGGKPPADFPCQWAWHDMFQVVLGLQLGANYPQYENGIAYVSCSDGLHPVFFKLERLE